MFRFIIFTSLVFLTGCVWKNGSGFEEAIFAEDGESIAVVYQTFKKKNAFTHIKRKQHKSQIQLLGADGYEPLTEFLDGDVIEFFYQREAGYVLMGRRGDRVERDDGSEENWFAYDKFDLETGRRTPLETASGITQLSCDGGESSASTAPLVRLIPSPTGNLIARFAATTDCDERRYTISFLDAFEYTPISSPIEVFERSEELRSDGTDFWPMFDMAWTEDGAFALRGWHLGFNGEFMNSLLYHPDGRTPETHALHYQCMTAPTMSYFRNQDGIEVWIQSETGELTYSDNSGDTGFGCGTFE